MQEPQLQPTFEFRFIRLPAAPEFAWRPDDPATMEKAVQFMHEFCGDLTHSSKQGRLGPILKVEGGFVIGELTGYVGVGPDPSAVVPVAGILKPS